MQKYEVSVNLAQDFTDAQKAQARNNIGAAGMSDIPDVYPSIMVTPWSDFQEWDGTTPIQFKDAWTSRTGVQVVGDKVDLKIKEGDTKYRIAVKKLGVYRLTVWFDVKWEGTPVNKTGKLNGFPLDFSKAFEESFASPVITDIAVINLDAQEWYYLGITRITLDAPAGTKVSVRATVEYLGPCEPSVT